MVALPSALRGFSSIICQFECAARRGTVDELFDLLSYRVEAACLRVSERATKQGLTDIDETPIAVVFGGEATAVGDDTLATGLMLGKAVDVGLVTYAMGTCAFTAVAENDGSPDDGSAVAMTSTFASVTGADFVIVITRSGSTPLEAGADVAASTSQTSFLAIDLEFWDSARGPIVVEYDMTLCRFIVDTDLDGNLTTLEVLMEAFGEDTLNDVDSTVLSVENQISTTTATGILALG